MGYKTKVFVVIITSRCQSLKLSFWSSILLGMRASSQLGYPTMPYKNQQRSVFNTVVSCTNPYEMFTKFFVSHAIGIFFVLTLL